MLWFKEMCLGVTLARGGSVMVDLDCQSDWIEKCLGE
jgi:hypothetical protein